MHNAARADAGTRPALFVTITTAARRFASLFGRAGSAVPMHSSPFTPTLDEELATLLRCCTPKQG